MDSKEKTLKEYQGRLSRVRDELNRIKKLREPVVVQERRTANTSVIQLVDVGKRFARGTVECMVGDDITYFPYTINYADVITGAVELKGVNIK